MSIDKKGMTVSDIVKKTKLPQAVVSQHLSMIKLRGILYTERKGKFVVYKIKYPEFLEAFKIIRKVNKKIQNK
jgi:DNA-binding transcriptional ArsR family regulator